MTSIWSNHSEKVKPSCQKWLDVLVFRRTLGAEGSHFSTLRALTQVLNLMFAGGAILFRGFLVDPAGFRGRVFGFRSLDMLKAMHANLRRPTCLLCSVKARRATILSAAPPTMLRGRSWSWSLASLGLRV